MVVDGQTLTAGTVDLSEGGAQVIGTEMVARGTVGELWIDGMASKLSFTVLGSTGNALHLAFTLDDAARAVLRRFLAGHEIESEAA